ncbi:rna polymerase ii mediator complex component srb4 [Moniliophthora roreri MCA 2997]|uniref:Mediator of RNA polymerase II transcription subunit 17 n=1 Tax=Moniliophthora roreri (strain MCA 2997) TaxID=1381753 RepID=V2XNT2_MONRO|nr:rna polymerase ii mediator complex component srb4 [Moniliophthora roreri MCA 2997]
MQDSSHWKQTELSLERPYKNDNGELLPTLFDITADGELIYEPKESSAQILGDNLYRIFAERGADFFEQNPPGFLEIGILQTSEPKAETAVEDEGENNEEETGESKLMTVEELFKMRMEIMPQLYIALGELSHARDLLSLILSSANPNPGSETNMGPSTLSATVVTKPPSIIPLQAFNAQLAIGSKDEALRRASDIFKTAADRMERTRLRNERYWVDALKIRRGNWGLTPAPLPLGAPTGKGADKTTKDFVISYGLEESPPAFRRRAVAQMSYTGPDNLVFPHRQNTRLRIGVTSTRADGSRVVAYNNTSESIAHEESLGILKTAQREVIEQEIFAQIGKEAGTLPTASARVSERLIHIDAAQNTELTFELIDNKASISEAVDSIDQAKCDFIYYYLLALLLRRHAYHKQRRLGSGSAGSLMQKTTQGQSEAAPAILEPVIHLLQYQVFTRRVNIELNTACTALNKAGIQTTLRFNAVEEIGKELVNLVANQDIENMTVGGEAVLRVDGRYTIRLTMGSPSTLTAHLSQATINILSIPELCKLLKDEIEKIVLERICGLGRQICGDLGAIWFVDMNRCVGRWDGCVLNFCVEEEEQLEFSCVASRFGRKGKEPSLVETYNMSSNTPILAWAKDVISQSL